MIYYSQDVLAIYNLHFLLKFYGDHRDLHSFPTRRSSDLKIAFRFEGLGIERLGHQCLLPHEQQVTIEIFGLGFVEGQPSLLDRKSTRLNSSHSSISYAVFCLKKKI